MPQLINGVEFPDDASDAEVLAFFEANPDLVDDAPAETPRTWTDRAVDALPSIGGSVGGMVAGPKGAALGGAAGEGFRQVARHAREIPDALADVARNLVDHPSETLRGGLAGIMSGARDAALEGGKQASTEWVGAKVGKGLQRGGRALYRGLLKPSSALTDDFGGDAIVDTLMREGATISNKGADRATKALTGSRARALQIVQDVAGAEDVAPVTAREVGRGLSSARKTLRLRKAAGQPDKTGAVRKRLESLADSLHGKPVPVSQAVTFADEVVPTAGPTSFTSLTVPPGVLRKRAVPGAVTSARIGEGIDLVRAQQLKETAQDAASGAYRLVARGQRPQIGAKGLLDEGTARGFRQAIERRAPQVKAQNARTQELVGGSRALNEALDRTANNLPAGPRDAIAAVLGSTIAGPGGAAVGVGTSMLSRLLMSPRAGSALAIAMDRTGKHVPIDDLIRALEVLAQESQ